MRALLLLASVVVFLLHSAAALAQPLILEDAVPEGGPDHFMVPFEVPEGTVEIEVRHQALPDGNVLDFGVWDPERFRGYGGGNTEPFIVGEHASSRSYLTGPIPAGTWQVLVGKAKVVNTPARYRLEIHLRTLATLAPQPERAGYVKAPALENTARWYAGDFHVHSKESGDARPPLDEIATFARGRGLDFVVVTDHNTTSHLDFIGAAQARHPSLLLLPGVEFTTYAGHANGIGATAFVDFRLGREGRTLDEVTAEFAAQGAVFSINHPVLDLGDACIGCAWKHDLDRSRVGAVEIQTGAWSVVGPIFGERPLRFWDAYATQGLKVAALGGSDDHRAGVAPSSLQSPIGSPTTLVFAEALSHDAIVDAVRRGRTVVKLEGPDDPMVELRAGEAVVGDTVSGDVTVTATVTGGLGAQLRWVRDGKAETQVAVDADPFVLELPVTAPDEGELRLRAEVLVEGKPRTVTGHLWIAPASAAEDERGCGCTSAATPATFALVLGLVRVVRRQRRRRL